MVEVLGDDAAASGARHWWWRRMPGTRAVASRALTMCGPVPVYRKLTSDYMLLVDDITAADRRDEVDFTPFTARAEALADGFRALGGAVVLRKLTAGLLIARPA